MKGPSLSGRPFRIRHGHWLFHRNTSPDKMTTSYQTPTVPATKRYRERSVLNRIRSRRYRADETPYPARTT